MRLIGLCRLGRDADTRYTSNGDAVANFSAAFEFGTKGEDGKRQTQWVTLSLFGKRAEKLSEYLTKGKQLYIVANDVHLRTYEKKDGGTGVELRGRVEDVQFVGSKDEQRSDDRPAQNQPTAADPHKDGIAGLDDDIPF